MTEQIKKIKDKKDDELVGVVFGLHWLFSENKYLILHIYMI